MYIVRTLFGSGLTKWSYAAMLHFQHQFIYFYYFPLNFSIKGQRVFLLLLKSELLTQKRNGRNTRNYYILFRPRGAIPYYACILYNLTFSSSFRAKLFNMLYYLICEKIWVRSFFRQCIFFNMV